MRKLLMLSISLVIPALSLASSERIDYVCKVNLIGSNTPLRPLEGPAPVSLSEDTKKALNFRWPKNNLEVTLENSSGELIAELAHTTSMDESYVLNTKITQKLYVKPSKVQKDEDIVTSAEISGNVTSMTRLNEHKISSLNPGKVDLTIEDVFSATHPLVYKVYCTTDRNYDFSLMANGL